MASLQCRRILGSRNLVRLRDIVVATQPPSLILWQWKIGESRNSNPYGTLTVGARAKEGKKGGGEEKKKMLSLLSPRPLPAPFDSPHLLLSSGSFNMARSRANCALKENACTAGYRCDGYYTNVMSRKDTANWPRPKRGHRTNLNLRYLKANTDQCRVTPSWSTFNLESLMSILLKQF